MTTARARKEPPTQPTAATAATEPLPTPAATNRQAMPHLPSVVDEFRKAFGADQVRVTFAEENGARLGRLEAYEERAAIMEFDGGMTRQEAEQKAGTCYYCRHWQGTKSGKGYCVIGFAPPVVRQAGETCGQFTLEARP